MRKIFFGLLLFLLSPQGFLLFGQVSTGPEVGQKLPGFRARDQHGKMQSFKSLSGPNGLLLLFYRSADW